MKASSLLIFMLIVVLPFAALAQFSTGQNASGVIGQNGYTYTGANITDSIGMTWPCGIAVDPVSGAVYVADKDNNRVLRFANLASLTNGCAALGVLGQPDFASGYGGTAQNRMCDPSGVAVDGSGNLYVADCRNNRVLKFANAASKANGANADVVLGQTGFTTRVSSTSLSGMNYTADVAVDGSGNLYVADGLNNRVLKFANAASKTSGANADLVLGQPNYTSSHAATSQAGMSGPEGVAVDGSGNLYVADCDNNRILIFKSVASKANGDQADVVLGQPDFVTTGNNTTVNGISCPYGVAVDASGNLYVADDDGNNRVLKFADAASKDNGADADAVFGQADFTSNDCDVAQNKMNSPNGLAVDGSGNLYVGDSGNNRVVIFTSAAGKANGAAADRVLGQSCFTKGGANIVDRCGLNSPDLIAVDPVSGALYVADEQNNRVLRFANAASYTAGEGALGVLGQPDFVSSSTATSRCGMYYPTGVAVDWTGNLYVADFINNRVLIFLNAASKPDGSDADIVLGQSDFGSGGGSATRWGMRFPYGVAVDGSGTLYVADQSNNRVLIFLNAASLASGAGADVVLGQPNFSSSEYVFPPRQNSLNYPHGVAVDESGNLYVADASSNRVLLFANAASKSNGANADLVLGQSGFASHTSAATQNGMFYPQGVAVDGLGTLYVSDDNNCRVLVFKNAGSLANGANADVVLGQTNFTSSGFGISQCGMYFPLGVAVDNHAGKLYVSDNALNRVLVFDAASALPVELISFGVTAARSAAMLEWTTATEINNAGFDVERKSMNNEQSTKNGWTKVGFVAGHGTTNSPQHYSYSDDVGASGTYSYLLKQIDHNGAFTYSQEVSVQAGEVPRVFALAQNYPNPFNPATTLQFTVPNDGRATLKVYNTIGQEVATLFDGRASAGEYHQATFDGSRFASGIYLARLVFGGQTLVKKLLMTK